ncbi:MAG: TVP38/TMEM64 family protein [Spirochaetes bacterium]|nr:TVP38/TMEM64 family protein [Spirochaetota bacterium]
MGKSGRGRTLALIGFPLLLVALAVPVVIWRRELWELFSSARRLREWVSGWGAVAPLVFVAVQALQVVVFVIPGEVPQIAAGYLFGAPLGTALSLAGILVGSAASFFLARLLGRPFVGALFPGPQVERIEKLLATRGARIVFFLLFLIPGIPKDILCYVAGITSMGFPFFAAASTLGRLPGIIGSAIIGSAAAAERWVLMGIVALASVLLFGAGLLLRPRIQAELERIAEKRRGEPPSSPTAS